MKKIAASVIVLLFTIAASAQGQVSLSKEEKKALKLEQKKQKETELSMNTAEALRSGTFVLKADRIRGRGGPSMNVDPTINFVAVEGKDAYVQVSPSSGYGLNGLGGVTLRGKITSLDIEQGKKHGSYNIVVNTIGHGGNITIFMNVNKTGEMASATVNTNWGNRIELNGYLVPWTGTGTKIHKGRENF
ncbi:MAG: DUF4251 domain-containing protein [Bacteroidales bacterium]|nr:DUF4251 domain-containing protein [Bacteroidales bacterium]